MRPAPHTKIFALWKDADPDIPILKEAQTEFANRYPRRLRACSASAHHAPAGTRADRRIAVVRSTHKMGQGD